MIYGANGEIFKTWDDAKSKVESVPADAAPGTPRTYPVDAYVEDENGNRAQVNGFWFSELSEETRKPLLRELGLPITKKIMYRDRDTVSQVLDFKIEDVWDRWCNVVVKLADGTITNRTHSWYFSDMNSVPEKADAATPKKKKAVAKKKTVEPTDDVPGLPNTYIVFDLETTGLNCADCQIAEIGAIKVRDGKVSDKFSQLVYIDFPMPRAALNVNNITDEMLADAPHATEAMKSFIEFIGEGAVLVGHNIKRYDLPIMERVATACRLDFDYTEVIDTYQLAQRAWPNLERWSMQALRELLNIKNDDAHRALADCEDEMSVYDAIRNGVKSGELSIEPSRRRASRPGAVYNKTGATRSRPRTSSRPPMSSMSRTRCSASSSLCQETWRCSVATG